MRIFGRDPALWLALFAVVIKCVAAFWIDLGIEQQSALNATAAAVVGVATAIIVHDGISAAILGGVQAVLALAIGFGLRLDPDSQAIVMSLIATVVAMFERTQVTAPVGPNGALR
jgi:asparagine N-glycosylation enzyme membrane subunit Stt3